MGPQKRAIGTSLHPRVRATATAGRAPLFFVRSSLVCATLKRNIEYYVGGRAPLRSFGGRSGTLDF